MESIRSWSQDRYITSSPHFSAIGGGEGGGGKGGATKTLTKSKGGMKHIFGNQREWKGAGSFRVFSFV